MIAKFGEADLCDIDQPTRFIGSPISWSLVTASTIASPTIW
jgi:hypothetical protein